MNWINSLNLCFRACSALPRGLLLPLIRWLWPGGKTAASERGTAGLNHCYKGQSSFPFSALNSTKLSLRWKMKQRGDSGPLRDMSMSSTRCFWGKWMKPKSCFLQRLCMFEGRLHSNTQQKEQCCFCSGCGTLDQIITLIGFLKIIGVSSLQVGLWQCSHSSPCKNHPTT